MGSWSEHWTSTVQVILTSPCMTKPQTEGVSVLSKWWMWEEVTTTTDYRSWLTLGVGIRETLPTLVHVACKDLYNKITFNGEQKRLSKGPRKQGQEERKSCLRIEHYHHFTACSSLFCFRCHCPSPQLPSIHPTGSDHRCGERLLQSFPWGNLNHCQV